MATTNTCKKCGCQDSFIPSPAPCPTPQGCPNPEPCSEVLDSQCVIYSGTNIRCGADTLVTTNDSVAEALDSIVNYFCGRSIIQSDVLCGQDTVVAENTAIEDALVDIVDYFCTNSSITSNILCGNTTVVSANSTFNEAFVDVVDYFCDATTIQSNILCGTDTVVATGASVTNAIEDVVDYFCNEVSQIIPITSFRAVTGLPQNINAVVTPTVADAFIGNGDTITNLTVGYQLVNNVTTTQYAPVTGQWTCPQTGKYDINYNIYLSAPASVTTPGKNGWGEFGGSIQIGVTTTNGLSTYAADIISLPVGVPFLRVYGTGVLQGVQLNAGTVIVLKILNLSGIDYTSVSGDNIDWSIRRVG